MVFRSRSLIALNSPSSWQRPQATSSWVIRQHLETAISEEEIASDVDVENVSLALWLFAGGIGQRSIIHPELLTPEM